MLGLARFKQIVSIAAGIMTGIVIATSSNASPRVSGDKTAWGEITVAYDRLKLLPGFRVRQAVQHGSVIVNSAIFEIVPPRNVHIIAQMSETLKLEVIGVGNETRDREIDRGAATPWRCNALHSPGLLRGPDDAVGDVRVWKGADTVIDGTPVHAYSFSYSPSTSTTMNASVWVGVRTGLPRRFMTATDSGNLTQDFYDYGAKIHIALPHCG